MTVFLAVQVVLLIGLVGFLAWRGSRAPTDPALARELADLRMRMDAIAAGQGEVPVALAEARATHAETLADEFARLTQTVGGQLEAARRSVDGRLEATGEVVSAVRERLGELTEATRRLEDLGKTVARVHQLLRVPTSRGALGEVWLEEILRQMFPDTLFEMQYTFPTGERVDAVLRVGDRLVPIDAKFPLDACERMLSGTGEEIARERRAFHRSVRTRIDEVADKYILPEYDTYDFALMYIPAERVYYETVAGDGQNVINHAMTRRVILVSPNTFYAYLTAILHGLRGLQVDQRAHEILAVLDATQAKVERLQRAHELLGKHLDNAVKQYVEADRQLRSLGGRVSQFADPVAAARSPVLPPFAG